MLVQRADYHTAPGPFGCLIGSRMDLGGNDVSIHDSIEVAVRHPESNRQDDTEGLTVVQSGPASTAHRQIHFGGGLA